MSANNILYKDFGSYANRVTEDLKNHIKQLTDKVNRPYIYLNSSKISKEATALKALKDNPIESGLICTIATVELCSSLQAIPNKETQKLELRNVNRKCLYFYFYFLDPEFGFMHIKLQSWFPFMVQVYLNGREYLAKKLDKEGIEYRRYDNSFTYISDIEKAQEIANKIESVKLTGRLDAIVSKLNPYLSTIQDTFSMGYYWCVDQCEYATDIMFNNRKDLEEIYPSLVEHALDSLADVVPAGEIIKEIENVTQRKRRNNRYQSGFNVWSPETSLMFSIIMDGSHTINGFTNKDICAKLYPTQNKEPKMRNKVTRLFSKLLAHGLIRKAPRLRKYYVTSKGYRVMGGVLYLKEKECTGYALNKMHSEKTPA